MEEVLTDRWNASLRRRLLAWYRQNARELPWRTSPEPYWVWVSEIMLQQTQVATVLPYFQRFLAAFPSLTALAAAEEQPVLRLWEGLGYYRRARNLHAAAKKIVSEHGGVFPSDAVSVRALPGIGRYTAGAILSIAFDARQPILEANTIRLFSRLIGYRDDVQSVAGQKQLWYAAEQLLPPGRGSGAINQALMDLGSQVCTPRTPACDQCPLRLLCSACLNNLQDQIPRPKSRPKLEDVLEAAVVIWRNGRVLLRRCRADQRWAGLWDFPRFAIEHASGAAQRYELIDKLQTETGLIVSPSKQLATFRHGVTRFRITLQCHLAEYVSGAKRSDERLRWVKPAELEALPLSTTGRKICGLIRLGKMPVEKT